MYENDLDYLQDELNWLEARCERLATQRVLSEDGGGSFFSRRDEDPEVAAKRLKRQCKAEKALRKRIDERLLEHQEAGRPTALDQLCSLHGLDEFERLVLLAAAAPGFSERFVELYGDAFNASGTTVEAMFRLAELGFAECVRRRATFRSDAPLIRHDLMALDIRGRYTAPEDLLTAKLQVTPRTFAFLTGAEGLTDEFIEFSSLEKPLATMEQVVLDAETMAQVLAAVDNHERYLDYRQAWGIDAQVRYGRGVILLFHGDPGTGKTMLAHAVADRLGKRILTVDIPTLINHCGADRLLPGLFREARLRDAVLFFDECESVMGSRRAGNQLMTQLLTEIERFEGIAVLATNMPEMLDEALERRILVRIPFSKPDRAARERIWLQHLPATAPLAADVDVDELAERFDLAGGYIKNAVLVAVATAVHEMADPTITMEHLMNAARAQCRRVCAHADTRLVYPRVTLEDVVLPPALADQVEELVDGARHRRRVLEQWGIGQRLTYGTGISALFHGPSGTGKTLCAEAVAGELNLPLLRADASTLISRWMGDSERNVGQLFDDAKAEGAVIFLDEVDSLLRARNDQNHIHDQRVVNTLLTRIESHSGIVLMATNFSGGLDDALSRRLTYNLAFPLPDETCRATIWRALLPDKAPVADDVDFGRLARVKLSGGEIKNAVFAAAFRAARADGVITMALLQAAAGEQCADPKGSLGFAA